jgi:hypothetical protein
MEFNMKYVITYRDHSTQEVEAGLHHEEGSYTTFVRWDGTTDVKVLSVHTKDVRDIRETDTEDRKSAPSRSGRVW